MIRVLIIDDEPLVRMGMKTIIEWEKHGYVIVGEAGNGIQGLERMQELEPDIVLVDIMMPQMTGLELITKSIEKGFLGKFIILSCMTEIEYLQEAIRLGVSRYILKSTVKPSEILQTVDEVSRELKKNQVFSNDVGQYYRNLNGSYARNEFLNLVLKGVIHTREEIVENLRHFGFLPDSGANLQVYAASGEHVRNREKLYKAASIGKSILDEKERGCCFVNYEDYLIVFIQNAGETQLVELSFRICASAKQYFDLKLKAVSIRIEPDKWQCYQQYQIAKQELAQKFFGKEKEGTSQGALRLTTEYASYEKLSAALEIIKGMLVQSRVVSEKEAKKVYAGAIEYVILMYELDIEEILKTDSKTTVLSYLEAFDSFEELHKNTLSILMRAYEQAEKKGFKEYHDELTDKMVAYIHTHCNDKISTRDVANHIHFSIDYTCKYFKKKTQTNLTDYILKLKIYMSRQDLLAGESVSKVSEKYGFSSDGHYVKTFKRYEGITPGAFARKNGIA